MTDEPLGIVAEIRARQDRLAAAAEHMSENARRRLPGAYRTMKLPEIQARPKPPHKRELAPPPPEPTTPIERGKTAGRYDAVMSRKQGRPAVERIIRICGDLHGFSVYAITSANRTRSLSYCRRMVYVLALRHTGLSKANVAKLCNVDHTSVVYGCKKHAVIMTIASMPDRGAVPWAKSANVGTEAAREYAALFARCEAAVVAL